MTKRHSHPQTPAPMSQVQPSTFDKVLAAMPKPAAEVVTKVRKDVAERPGRLDLRLSLDGGALTVGYHIPSEVTPEHYLMMADMGTTEVSFADGMLAQIATLGAQGRKVDEGNTNFVLSVVRGLEPRNEIEAMLAAQMGAVHIATMAMARRVNHVENIPQQDSANASLNKLARTFATQIEAFKRLRDGGQQKVTVEHVTVNSGGQAIVGNVVRGGGGTSENEH